ncbi:MAG: DUF4276 family protein [Blastocatellia bacterium]|nr:DUF4276 family protein [Blastocatellia bacterium]
MHIEFLVEEQSMEEVLNNIVPKIIGDKIEFKIRCFSGKGNLLKKLPDRFKGYKNQFDNNVLSPDTRIIVVIDRDRDNCEELKEQLEKIAENAALTTKTKSKESSDYQIVNRIVVEELEAWFFGDIEAVATAYPKIPTTTAQKKRYRNPDNIKGAWQALEKVLQEKDYPDSKSKLKVAKNISQHMDPERNTSKSFQVFKQALQELLK